MPVDSTVCSPETQVASSLADQTRPLVIPSDVAPRVLHALGSQPGAVDYPFSEVEKDGRETCSMGARVIEPVLNGETTFFHSGQCERDRLEVSVLGTCEPSFLLEVEKVGGEKCSLGGVKMSLFLMVSLLYSTPGSVGGVGSRLLSLMSRLVSLLF